MSTQTEKHDRFNVFISGRDSVFDECKEKLGRQRWITLKGEKGALYLACSDLDQLEFLRPAVSTLEKRGLALPAPSTLLWMVGATVDHGPVCVNNNRTKN